MLTQMPGYDIRILSIDTAIDPSLNIHDEALWRFLIHTARAGRILGLLQGHDLSYYTTLKFALIFILYQNISCFINIYIISCYIILKLILILKCLCDFFGIFLYYSFFVFFIEGSLEVKRPTTWRDGKAEVGRVREEKKRSETIREEKEREERTCRRAKGRKVTIRCVFPMVCGSGGSKSNFAAGAEPAGQMKDEKLHAIVARSTFRSQNVQSTPFSDHFWK